jgi:hypothetical protein
LFRQYLPVIRTVAEAGWRPVTRATCDNPAIWIERFGPDRNGVRYYTLFTEAAQDQTGVLLEESEYGTGTNDVATDLLSGNILPRINGGWRVTLASPATAVVRLQPGPRLRSAQFAPDNRVRLTIESPLQLPQILESAPDLVTWQPCLTNTPSESPYVIDLPRSTSASAEFYRLRY